MQKLRKFYHLAVYTLVTLVLTGLLSSCGVAKLPDLSDLPVELPSLPGIPDSLSELPGLLEDLGLSDLSQIANLPDLEDLPFFQPQPGVIAYNGPLEKRLEIGDTLPGTDIQLVRVANDSAEFLIDGLRSTRTTGDSLDFDGPWPGLEGATYYLRLRIYRLGDDSVRVAGVHQLKLENIEAEQISISIGGFSMKFPFTDGVNPGEQIAGTTYGYVGLDERGAQISGLAEGAYPYYKTGDSIRWQGIVRENILVDYQLRLLLYGEDSARVGGIVTVALPTQ